MLIPGRGPRCKRFLPTPRRNVSSADTTYNDISLPIRNYLRLSKIDSKIDLFSINKT